MDKGNYSPAADAKGAKSSIIQAVINEASCWGGDSPNRRETITSEMVTLKNKLVAGTNQDIVAAAVVS